MLDVKECESVESGAGEIEWMALHTRLRGYRFQRAELDAAELFDLARADGMRVYLLWRLRDDVRVHGARAGVCAAYGARAASRGPCTGDAAVTAASLATGMITYSAVREVTRVATPETEAAWVAAVAGRTVRQIEEAVSGHVVGDRPGDPTHPDLRPRIVRLELPPEVYATAPPGEGGARRRAECRGRRCRADRDPVPANAGSERWRGWACASDRVQAVSRLPSRHAERRRP